MTAAPAIVTLQCGCFFRGREMVVDSGCEEHQEPADIDDESDEKTEFSFDELSARAKEHARDYYRATGLDYDWWDSTYEDADTIAAMMGIEIKRKHHQTYSRHIISGPQIWFSGFYSQGDGAC